MNYKNKEEYLNCAPRNEYGYIDGNRGSGRTTLMMNRVRELAHEGYDCVIVVATEQQRKNLRFPMGPVHYSSGGTIRCISSANLDRDLRGLSSKTVVFYDHHATDYALIEQKRKNYYLSETNKRLNQQLNAAEQKMADQEYPLNQSRKAISITQQCRDMGLLDKDENVSVEHLLLQIDELHARCDAYATILDELETTEEDFRRFLVFVEEREIRETATRKYIESIDKYLKYPENFPK